MQPKKTQNCQSAEEKVQAGGLILSDFRQYCRTSVIRTSLYWHKSRQTDRWNRIESLERNPHTWSINLCQRRQAYTMEGKKKNSLFSNWCWESWMGGYKLMKLEHSLTPYTKTNSKWFKDPNMPWHNKTPRRHELWQYFLTSFNILFRTRQQK